MIQVLYEHAKNDPKDFILSVLTIVMLFVGLWGTLWIHAICVGNV